MSNVSEPPVKPARVRKFDRPRPPRDWRYWVGGLGKTLIAAGLLMFGFVAYQLWGTGIETARSQNALQNEFENLIAGTPTIAPIVTTDTPPTDTSATTPTPTTPTPTTPTDTVGDPVTTTVPVALPVIQEGDAIARIEMPTIGVDNIVVAGVEKADLKRGPGHYPQTPMPGQFGNAAIAGHRTTYGQPFFNIDRLADGDEIVVTTPTGRYVYRVTGQQIVSPSDYQVIATTDPTKATLTLTSCHPKWTARERIVITAELDIAASQGPVGEPVLNYGRPLIESTDPTPDPTNTVVVPTNTTPTSNPAMVAGGNPTPVDGSGTDAGAEAINTGIADSFSQGWFSDPTANAQVALWGALLAAVGILSYLLSRTTRRDWVGLTVGVVPFLIVVYFFFQNVNRLLPPNL